MIRAHQDRIGLPSPYTMQEMVHEIACYPASEIEKAGTSQDGSETTEGDEQQGVEVGTEGGDSHEPDPEGWKMHQKRGTGGSPVLDLSTLSDDAMDEIVSSMIRQTALEDPDIDFLGLLDNQDLDEYSGANEPEQGGTSAEQFDNSNEDADEHMIHNEL